MRRCQSTKWNNKYIINVYSWGSVVIFDITGVSWWALWYSACVQHPCLRALWPTPVFKMTFSPAVGVMCTFGVQVVILGIAEVS